MPATIELKGVKAEAIDGVWKCKGDSSLPELLSTVYAATRDPFEYVPDIDYAMAHAAVKHAGAKLLSFTPQKFGLGIDGSPEQLTKKFSDDLVTIAVGEQVEVSFEGTFITVHGHPVYIGDKKGGEAGGGSAGGAASSDPEETPRQRESRLRTAAEDYGSPESSIEYSRSLTKEQRAAITDYSHHGDKVINGHLRGVAYDHAESEESKKYVESIPALDEALNKAKTPTEMILYRGISGPMFAKVKAGSKFKDEGYLSTSTDPDIAEEFTGQHKKSAILRYEIPAGFEGAAPVQTLSLYKHENEVLIKRNAEWEVVEIKNHARVGTLSILMRPATVKGKGKKGEAKHSAAPVEEKRPIPYSRFVYTDPREIVWTEGGPDEEEEDEETAD